jgi:hypothetical protein
MKRFVKYFCRYKTSDLAKVINDYAEENRLLIISIAINDNNGTLVLFERS